MRKRLVAALAVTAAALVAVTGARAVMFGQPDTGNQYPWVGLVTFYDEDGVYLWRCSASAISPTVLLTAAHCTEPPAVSSQVWFDQGPIPAGAYPLRPVEDRPPCTGFTGWPCTGGAAFGTPIPHPDYDGFQTFPNTNDIGVVLLDTPVTLASYAALAPVGTLDSLATRRGEQETTFTVVGYGLQSVVPRESAERTRYFGTVSLVNLRSALSSGFNLAHTGAPGKGTGGSATCFGDSGGPILYDGQIVAVTSFGLNFVCMGPGFGYRTDLAHSYAWISGFLE
jgi:secreted trypsin-like serine protease